MNSGIIGLIILVSILVGILVLVLMKSMFEEKKLNRLIGQDLTSYTKEELLELKDRYQTYAQYQSYSREFCKETDRIMNEIFMRENTFYKLFLKRFPYKISQQESDFIQNHILSETEIIFIINETQKLLTEAFILIRLISTHGTIQEDFKIISSIADYLHNIPVSLKTIMAEKKLNFCYIEFIKRLNSFCSEILKTDFPDIYTLYVKHYISSFTDMKKITDNIISKTIHPEEI